MGIYAGVIIGGFSGYAADSPALGWRWAFDLCGIVGLVYFLQWPNVPTGDYALTAVASDNASGQVRSANYKKCIEISINAGMDMVMVPERYREFFDGLKKLSYILMY